MSGRRRGSFVPNESEPDSFILNDALSHLIRKNAGCDSPGMALIDPSFVAEFTKLLDSSQDGTLNQFVETENASFKPAAPTSLGSVWKGSTKRISQSKAS
jgi:hypothetical protein